MNFVCVLKTGGIYTDAHVERLRAMLWKPVICLTDDPEVTGPKLPLVHGWKGWWSKLELFEHDFGHVCYFDLDVTVNHLDWLKGLDKSEFYMMADAYQPGGCPVNSSVMVWDGPRIDLVNVSDKEMEHPGGDQHWIWQRLGDAIKLINPPDIVSFKKHGASPENGVVVYHGKPKPWDIVEFKHELLALFPNSKMAKADQYTLAWAALHTEKEKYSAGERSHAKCWLTYRTFDGEVTLDSWRANIQPVQIELTGDAQMDARWQSSQAAAEVFLFIQNRMEWIPSAQAYMDTMESTNILSDNPGATGNLTRIGSLIAYSHMMNGDHEKAALVIANTWKLWNGSWTTFNPTEHPYRYVEMRHDSLPLYAMTRMMHAMNRIPVHFYRPDWAENMLKEKAGSPWFRSIIALGRREGAIW